MFCTRCGYEIEKGNKFCTNCGTMVNELENQKETDEQNVSDNKENEQQLSKVEKICIVLELIIIFAFAIYLLIHQGVLPFGKL